MELYIEYVILDNILMTYLILKLIDITTGCRIKKLNKLIVCLLGSIFAIFLPYLYFNKILLFCYRIVVSFILVLCTKRFKKFKNYLGIYSLFMTYTFVVGGVCFGLINLLGIEYNSTNLIMNSFEFPLGVFITIFLLVIKVLFKIITLVKYKLKNSNYMYEITLFDGEKTAKSTAFYDTGNNVNFEKCGVNIISINLFLQLYKDIDLSEILLKNNISTLKEVNYINIAGIGKDEKYLSFVIDKIQVNGCDYDKPRMAVAIKNFGDYDCILHKQFVKGE